jgi:hypothetical protein
MAVNANSTIRTRENPKIPGNIVTMKADNIPTFWLHKCLPILYIEKSNINIKIILDITAKSIVGFRKKDKKIPVIIMNKGGR